MEYFQPIISFFAVRIWFFEACLAILFTWPMVVIVSKVLNKAFESNRNSGHLVIAMIIGSVTKPVKLAIMIFGLFTCVIIPVNHFQWSVGEFLETLRNVAMLSMLVWCFIRLISDFDKSNNNGQLPVVNRTRFTSILLFFRVAALAIFVILLVKALGYSLTGFVAFGSVSAIVIGLAARTWIENALAYLTIQSNNKYELGDSISLPELKLEGIVEAMTLSSTFIRDQDKNLVSIPNGVFLTKYVSNVTRMSHRHFNYKLPISLDDIKLVPDALKTLRKLFERDDRVDSQLRILANITDYDDKGGFFYIVIDFYMIPMQVERFYAERQDFILLVIDTLRRYNIDLARYDQYALREPVPSL